jgi:hypothetical protein
MRRVLALVPCLLAACVPAAELSQDDQAVIGGSRTPDGMYPGVGAVMYDGEQGCTGTLIRPDVVLTAAHCVLPEFLGDLVPGFTLDHDARTGSPRIVPGSRAVVHEGFDFLVDPQPGLQEWHDIGLLWLAEPILDVEPVAWARPAEAAAGLAVGMDVEIVGYGRIDNDTDDHGIKFHAIAQLVAFNHAELQIGDGGGPQNCHGDSGGPALVDWGRGQRVIGVVSRSAAFEPDCDDGGIDTRVDYYQAWLEDQLCGGPCPEPEPEPEPEIDEAGCCSTGGGAPGTGALLLAGLVLLGLGRRRAAPRLGRRRR